MFLPFFQNHKADQYKYLQLYYNVLSQSSSTLSNRVSEFVALISFTFLDIKNEQEFLYYNLSLIYPYSIPLPAGIEPATSP